MDRLTGGRAAGARALVVVAAALFGTGCPSSHKDPPPPAESLEISSAAPRALGALAAGTDAAPPVGVQRRGPTPDDPFGLGVEPEEQELDGGTDGGVVAPGAPENLPL